MVLTLISLQETLQWNPKPWPDSGMVSVLNNFDVDGVANLDDVDIDADTDMAGALTLAGNADFNGNLDVEEPQRYARVQIYWGTSMSMVLPILIT